MRGSFVGISQQRVWLGSWFVCSALIASSSGVATAASAGAAPSPTPSPIAESVATPVPTPVRETEQEAAKPTVQLGFRADGRAVRSISRDEILSLPKRGALTVYEHQLGREMTYTAVPMNDLLDLAYGAKWRTREEFLFTCSDGYQPSIPVAEFLQYPAWVAVGLPDNAPFRLETAARKTIELGPFYIIWDNRSRLASGTDSPSLWPYQVVGIDLTNFVDRFGAIAPARNATPEAVRGFASFRKHCISCHRINGVGGEIGAELNYPENVTSWYRPGWLARWIDDPASMRFGTSMPGLKFMLKQTPDRERKKIAEDIIAYLRDVSNRREAPKPKAK